MKKVVICIDETPLNRAVCDYGFLIAKNLNLDVTFLYVVKTAVLSPNFLGLATGGLVVTHEDVLLDDVKPSKDEIEKGEELLQKAKELADEQGINATTQLQSGDLIEILINYENAHTIVVGVDEENNVIKDNIIALSRECESKLFFINKEFSEVKSLLVAFDGEQNSVRTLNFLKDSKVFGKELEYHVINVNKDIEKSQTILEQAKEIMKNENAKFVTLSGNVSEEIIAYRRANELSLYVMGSFSKSIFSTLFFGSTSQTVVEQAWVPVYIAK
ncbi:MAG: universal stress protein [Campylobacteraceae bacterium]|nr:universal stress protein [Campylobacteraceae bacterium]